MNLKSLNNIFKGDKVIWMVFFILCMVSIVEVYSASSTLSYKGGNYWAPLLKHVGMLVLGFFTMILVMNTKCRYFKIATLPALGFSFFLLIVVWLTGGVTNGASRWIEIMGIQFQPSELGKGALVLAVAQILSAMQTENGAARKAFKYILILSAIIIIPISFENLSTAMLAALTVLLMMFVGRVPLKQIPITSIKDQNRSGTCWDYSTLSYFEAEILKKTGKTYDLCESFVANKTYMERAIQVVRFHGDCQFAHLKTNIIFANTIG